MSLRDTYLKRLASVGILGREGELGVDNLGEDKIGIEKLGLDKLAGRKIYFFISSINVRFFLFFFNIFEIATVHYSILK